MTENRSDAFLPRNNSGWLVVVMQRNVDGTRTGPAAEIEGRCKHDLLVGSCGFCRVASGEAEPLHGPKLTAWLASFSHESPGPEALPRMPAPPGGNTCLHP
jgi:hypothetical protein